MSDLALLVLAAGGSTRMGRAKQLLPIGDQPLVRRTALAAIESGCRPVIVVLGCEHGAVSPLIADLDCIAVVNENWSRGIGTSIRAGVAAIVSHATQFDGLVILLADQWRVTAHVIRSLREEHDRAGKPITVSRFGDTIGPPVIVNRRFFPALQSLPDDQGAKSLWLNHPQEVHEALVPEAEDDIDTPGDYQRHAGKI